VVQSTKVLPFVSAGGFFAKVKKQAARKSWLAAETRYILIVLFVLKTIAN